MVYIAGRATGTEATSSIKPKGNMARNGLPSIPQYANTATANAITSTARYLAMRTINSSRRRGASATRTSSAVFP